MYIYQPALLERRTSYNLLILLLLFLNYYSNAQNSKIFSEDEYLSTRLQTHVLIHQDSISLSSLIPLFEKGIPIALKLLEKETISSSFLSEYKKYYRKLIVVSDNELGQVLTSDVEIILINQNDIQKITFEPNNFIENEVVNQDNLKKYRVVHYANFELDIQSLILKAWDQNGKFPNFIYANKTSLESVDSLVTQINVTRKVFGIVNSEDYLLKDVSFKNFKNRNASGYFSFPMDNYEGNPVLIPYKAGYHFSPDIIYVTPENFDNLKEFTGYKLDLDYGLSDYFKFGKTVNNEIRKNDSEIISNNLKIIEEGDLGNVGFFENRAYIDAGIKSKSSLQSSFTIATWIKPIHIDSNNSILGKGENFVLKLHNGYLTFTMAGIKDYISEASLISLNEWTHISLVHSKINNELLFYVNGELTDRVELIADYITSDYNLLIGSNLWEEFFIGYIGEIKIWERELNNNEILLQYNKPQSTSLGYSKIWFLIAGFFGFAFFLYFIFKTRKKKSKEKNNKIESKKPSSKRNFNPEIENYNEKILCFGELQIINNKGFDVGAKLSPKLKSLFILIFLHSYGSEKGISSKKLTEILWPGMSTKSAKNTRGTNIQNLRALLSSCSEIDLVFQNKKWRLNLSDECYCDYHCALNYFENILKPPYNKTLIEKEVPKLISILKKGRFLKNSNFSWLDPFIEKFSNLVIEKNIEFLNQFEIKEHSNILFSIAELITIYDDLNERSLELKLEVLRFQGKLSLAHTVYDNYIKLYKKLYNEDYKQSFEALISEKNII